MEKRKIYTLIESICDNDDDVIATTILSFADFSAAVGEAESRYNSTFDMILDKRGSIRHHDHADITKGYVTCQNDPYLDDWNNCWEIHTDKRNYYWRLVCSDLIE